MLCTYMLVEPTLWFGRGSCEVWQKFKMFGWGQLVLMLWLSSTSPERSRELPKSFE